MLSVRRALFLLLCALALPVGAATWYVRPSNACNGGVCGTADGSSYANAKNGLASVTALAAGDVVVLCGNFINEKLTIPASGTSIAPIIITGDCAPNVATYADIDGRNTTGVVTQTAGITASGKQWITVQYLAAHDHTTSNIILAGDNTTPCTGCKILHVTGYHNTTARACIGVELLLSGANRAVAATNILIQDVTANNCGLHGVAITEYTTDARISRANCSNAATVGNGWCIYARNPAEVASSSGGGCTSEWASLGGGVYSCTLASARTGYTVDALYFQGTNTDNCYHPAIGTYNALGACQWAQFGDNLQLRLGTQAPTRTNTLIVYGVSSGIVIEDSTVNGTNANPDGVGMGLDFGASGVVRRNRINSVPGDCIQLAGGSNMIAYSNIGVGCGRHGGRSWTPDAGQAWYNNMFSLSSAATGDAYRFDNVQPGITVTAKNNIGIGGTYCLSAALGVTGTYVEGYNDCYLPITSTYNGVSAGTGTITTNPLLDSNYRPLPGSPLIGAGTVVGPYHDYRNCRLSEPPTIGAYERCAGDWAGTRSLSVSLTQAASRTPAGAR